MPLRLIAPRPDKTPYWAVRGRHLGRYVDRSTKSSKRALAARILRKWERDIERGEFAEPGEPTFASAALAYMKAGGERTFMTPLLKHFRETPLTHIDQTAIDEAAAKLYGDRSAPTINRQVYTPMSAVLRRAGIALPLRRPKGSAGTKATGWLWPEEAGRLFEAARALDAEFAVLLILLCYTGARLGEALRLGTDQLKLDEAFAYLPDTKSGEPRAVFLPPIVIEELKAHPRGTDRPTETVFRFHKSGYLYSLLRAAAKNAGVKLPRRQAFHLLRHTYGTWMRRYGGLDTRGLVGTGTWKDRKSAERYEHVVVSEEAERAALLPNVTKGKRA